MPVFKPQTVLIRKNALEYPLGKKLESIFSKKDSKVHIISTRGPFPFDYDVSFKKKFHRAKKTIIVSVRSLSKFQSCKPSAHYQLPLISGCPANCQYCYLHTRKGKNPYIKIYVNIEEILKKAKKYINKRQPEITVFEGSANSDPLPLEKWTGSLAKTINYFAQEKLGRFRFVTKFTDIDSLLTVEHKNHTEFRFSLNSKYAIKKFEPDTPDLKERLAAAKKVKEANYKTGFLIAPIFIYDNWQEEYIQVIKNIKEILATEGQDITFELITHRFTESAKKVIKKAYPRTELPMNKEARQFKYGQFGYGKYVYPKETRNKIENHLQKNINKYLPEAEIKYFV